MAYDMTFMAVWLKKNKDDAKRAEAYDEAYPTWTEQEKAIADRLYSILTGRGLGPNGAKAFAVNLILFMHMTPDEQNECISHGQIIQREWEWAMSRKTRKQIAREMDEL